MQGSQRSPADTVPVAVSAEVEQTREGLKIRHRANIGRRIGAVRKGSRFPVSAIVQDYRRGLSVEEILRDFPALRPAEVHDALSYYYDHRADIDQEIAGLTDLNAAMQKYPPTLLPPADDRH